MNKFYLVSPLLLQTAIWIPTRIFLRFFCRFKVTGLENLRDLKKENGIIFAVNHSSEMDPILIPAALPFLSNLMPMFYVSRTADFYDTSGLLGKILYGGFFFKIWGAYSVYKTEEKGDYEFILKNHIDLLKKGKSLCIFPEGQKTPDGEMKEGKPGVAFLAHRINCKIVPVRIDGVFQISIKKILLRRNIVRVNFGKILMWQDLVEGSMDIGYEEYKNASKKIMEAINNIY